MDFKQYLDWRPVMTADQFWIALLKLVPYEVLTAYGIVRGAYATMSGSSGTALFVVDAALTVACFLLYRSAAKATVWAALSLSICFFLLVMSVDAERFRDMADSDLINFPKWLRMMFFNSLNPFYLVCAAVLICLSSSGLRRILGKQ
jgi:hypothetical protein